MDAQKLRLFVSVIVALFVITAVLGYVVYFIIQQHKKLLRLHVQNARAEINALEKDRARIAADLHDELAPMLVSVRMRINSLDLPLKEQVQIVEKTNITIDEMGRRMRAISFDLMPTALKSNGLVATLEAFIKHTYFTSGLDIRLQSGGVHLPLDDQQTIHLYRIFLEIIQNTVKHAKATELVIDLQKHKKFILISTRDNGAGFNYFEQMEQNKGLGLRSLLNRVSLLNGEFSIHSGPGKGTSITIEIPIDNEAALS